LFRIKEQQNKRRGREMQKKVLLVALGAALAVQGAWAQKKDKPEPDSVVELYGKVYPEIYTPKGDGATPAGTAVCSICIAAEGSNSVVRRQMLEASNSRFGIRGHEKLGRTGLKAIFQLETQFLVDQNNTPFAARDSFVGLTGGWGTVKLGRMDTPFKEYGDDISFLGISSGNFMSTSTVYRHIGMGGQANAARFHERRINAVTYESPDIGPAEFKVQYSTNENKTAARDPHVWSVGGEVELGPVTVLLGYEIHRDLFGLSANVPSALRNSGVASARSKDQAYAVGVKWKMGSHQFEIDANKKKYQEDGTGNGRVLSYENNSYLFIWDWRISQAWRAQAHYVRATAGKCSRVAAACNTNGLKGEMFSVGGSYYLSRRTYLFLVYSIVKNDFSARFNPTFDDDVSAGEDVKQLGFGIHTTF
jgi:predicted porin